MINTQTLKGNLINQDYSTAFTLNQGDKGVPFKVELLENGTPYTLQSSDIITIEWLKPNGNPFLQEGDISYGTTYIEFTTPEAIAQYSGSGSFNIIITNGDVRKGTIRREYKVVSTSMKPGSVSEDIVTDAITELRSLSAEIASTVQNNQELINNNTAATKSDIATVNSSLEEKANKIEFKERVGMVRYGEINMPDGFPSLPFKIWRDFDGLIKHNFDFNQFKNYTNVFYVKEDTGLESNDGLTTSTPVHSLRKAIELAQALPNNSKAIIKIMTPDSGLDPHINSKWGLPNVYPTTIMLKDISIVPNEEGKRIILSTALDLTWEKESTLTYSYKATASNTTNVYDRRLKDHNGVFIPLTLVSSKSEVDSNKNTWCMDGNTLYINLENG